MSDLPRVGLVGVGVMGAAYGANLRRKAFAVSGYDPAPAGPAALAEAGGAALPSPEAVAAQSDVILLALPSVAALRESVAAMAPELRANHVLAEMSTLPLDAKEAARAAVEAVGAAFLDCPVSGTGAQAAKGDLVVFASGDAEAIAVARPVFEALARDVREVGAFGAGMKLKYVANLLVSIHNLAAAEALLLAEKSGLDLQMVYDAISAGAGTSRMFEVRGPDMIAGVYEPAAMSMALYQKDVALILEHARSVGAPVPLMAATTPFYSAAMAQGRGRQDTAALFAVLKQLAEKAPS